MPGKKTMWLTALTFATVSAFAAGNDTRARQAGATAATPAGTFDSHGDVGTVLHPGSVEYDSAKRSYTIAGSGENIWLGSDAFQFAWKKLSGDITLTADITFLGKGVNEHRKAVLMIRQNLDADSPYVDVALHGSGLTSLQYREEKGAATHEIQADISAPKRLRIEKRGAYFSMWLHANRIERAVLRGHRRVQPRSRRGGKSGVLKRRIEAGRACSHGRRFHAVQRAGNHYGCFHRPARDLRGPRAVRGP